MRLEKPPRLVRAQRALAQARGGRSRRAPARERRPARSGARRSAMAAADAGKRRRPPRDRPPRNPRRSEKLSGEKPWSASGQARGRGKPWARAKRRRLSMASAGRDELPVRIARIDVAGEAPRSLTSTTLSALPSMTAPSESRVAVIICAEKRSVISAKRPRMPASAMAALSIATKVVSTFSPRFSRSAIAAAKLS